MNPLLQSLAVICFLLGSAALSADPAAEQNPAYQSTLENYQPLKEESLADWQTINQQAQSGGHAGHNMQPDTKENAAMDMPMNHDTMDHGSMDKSTQNQETMDHRSMDHSKPAPGITKPGNPVSTTKSVDYSTHAQQQATNKKVDSHDHATHEHDKLVAPNQDQVVTVTPDEMPAHHDHAGMNHDQVEESAANPEHTDTEVTDNPATTKADSSTVIRLEIIPNLHPAAVHFPIALTILAFVFHLLAYIRKDHENSVMLAAAGHYTLWIAAISAVVTVLLGWQAFNSISNHDDAGHAAMLLHRTWAIPTAITLTLLAGWDAWKYKANEFIPVPMLILLFLLTQAIAVTAWLGGEVVYRHGVGVLSIPSPSQATHDHAAGGNHAH